MTSQSIPDDVTMHYVMHQLWCEHVKSDIYLIVYRDSLIIWPLCAFFSILPQFYVPFYVKKRNKKNNFMCLLEFECVKILRAHSKAIPVYNNFIHGHIHGGLSEKS